jgi:hypothetical protein
VVPFPISLSGAVTVRDVTVEQALDRLEGALAQAKAGALRREGSAVQFRGGVFRLVSNWNVLVPISNGALEVSPSANGVSVTYRVTFGQMLVAVTLMVGAFFGSFVMTTPNTSVAGGLGILAVAWLWLFGGNFALTRWRLPAFLVRSLSRPAA